MGREAGEGGVASSQWAISQLHRQYRQKPQLKVRSQASEALSTRGQVLGEGQRSSYSTQARAPLSVSAAPQPECEQTGLVHRLIQQPLSALHWIFILGRAKRKEQESWAKSNTMSSQWGELTYTVRMHLVCAQHSAHLVLKGGLQTKRPHFDPSWQMTFSSK